MFFNVDGVGRIDVGSAAAASSFAALDRVVVLGDRSWSLGLGCTGVLWEAWNPEHYPPPTRVDIIAFVVEVKAAPVPGSPSVILDVPVEAEYSGSECGAGRSDIN